MQDRYDVIIIGTGAGGGPLAYRLAQAGKKILILERGEFLPREKENWNTSAVFLKNRYHTDEVWSDKDGNELHPGTGYWVGGNTKVYGAALFRLREKDFETLQHKGGISPEWPVKYDQFEPYYTQAERLFQVHGKQGIDPTEPWRTEDYSFAPISNEPRMQEIQDALVDSEVNCIREIMHLPHVKLLTGAKVTRLHTSSSGREVESVEVELKDSSKKMNFTGDLVVVACGAINSAALLLLSANPKHPRGLANSSDCVGRHFMFHKADAILAIGEKPNRSSYMKTLSVNDFYFGSPDYPFPMGNVQPIGSFHSEMMKQDAPPLTPKFILELMTTHAVPWWLTTEDLPDPNNRVTLRDGKVQLDYTENNEESFKRLRDTWIEVLKKTGNARHWLHLNAYFKKRIPLEGVGHQNGTCRFGRDAKTSVLDENCKAHDLNNLYVVDGSFFPSSGAVNPSLTIMANSLRVADHLISIMK
jgi:choline dehydrogenase-like flavoprotein